MEAAVRHCFQIFLHKQLPREHHSFHFSYCVPRCSVSLTVTFRSMVKNCVTLSCIRHRCLQSDDCWLLIGFRNGATTSASVHEVCNCFDEVFIGHSARNLGKQQSIVPLVCHCNSYFLSSMPRISFCIVHVFFRPSHVLSQRWSSRSLSLRLPTRSCSTFTKKRCRVRRDGGSGGEGDGGPTIGGYCHDCCVPHEKHLPWGWLAAFDKAEMDLNDCTRSTSWLQPRRRPW